MRSCGRLRRSSKSPKGRGSRRRRRSSGLWPQRKRGTVVEETPQNESNSHPPIRFVFTYRLYVSTIRPAGYPPYPRGLRVDGTQKPLTRQSRKDARGLSNPAWLGNGARCKRQDLLLPTGDARLRTSRLQERGPGDGGNDRARARPPGHSGGAEHANPHPSRHGRVFLPSTTVCSVCGQTHADLPDEATCRATSTPNGRRAAASTIQLRSIDEPVRARGEGGRKNG
jgi:hypothetical protein